MTPPPGHPATVSEANNHPATTRVRGRAASIHPITLVHPVSRQQLDASFAVRFNPRLHRTQWPPQSFDARFGL
jgi:hypothetical protein